MSTISIFPKAASQSGKLLRREIVSPASSYPSDMPEQSDADMMYAWSIGVTSAARGLNSRHENVNEECPPEVYIG